MKNGIKPFDKIKKNKGGIMLKRITLFLLLFCTIMTCVACSNTSNESSVSKESLHEQIKNARTIKSYQQGTQVEEMDSIKFGHNEKGEPIEWLIIDKDTNSAMLISKYILSRHNYVNGTSYVLYEDSEVRRWLNNEYVDVIFTKNEQNQINLLHLYTDYYHTNPPTEYMLIPSKSAIEYYFENCPNSFRKASDVPYGTSVSYMLSDEKDMSKSSNVPHGWIAAIGTEGEDSELPLYVGGSEGYPFGIRPVMQLKY